MFPQKNALILLGLTVSLLISPFSSTPSGISFPHATTVTLPLASEALSLLPSSSADVAADMIPLTSQAEVRTFIMSRSLVCNTNYRYVIPDLNPAVMGTPLVLFAVSSTQAPEGWILSHSVTNNQVTGVDELDTVKTDGVYIYIAKENRLVIVRAFPATEAGVVSSISVNGTIIGLFVNGDRLAILSQATYWKELVSEKLGPATVTSSFAHFVSYYDYSSVLTGWIYDIESRENPVLRMSISIEGSFIGARMIGDFVYLVGSQSIYSCGQEVGLPRLIVNNKSVERSTRVFHSDLEDTSYSFANILAFDISRGGEDASLESFLLGSSSTMYVSSNALYLTMPSWREDTTVIHRILLDRGSILYKSTGDVPGHILNQFSMDEYGQFFRVATHNYNSQAGGERTLAPGSNVYVLDKNLRIIGRLEGLGQHEDFHSARFMGERAYLVTFKKIDPLFVVDLRDPANPKLLGELKVPGYSDYLQPYDETHLIGIGKDADDQGSFAWYQGVKVALFDVSDTENPKEVGSFIVGDRGSNSPALYEHKAVLFDKDRNLLVIPVTVALKLANQTDPSSWGKLVFQGAYVFNISPEAGIEFRGGITHLQEGEVPDWYSFNRHVTRSLFIENVLYTLSPAMIKMNNLADLSEAGFLSL